MDPTAYYYMPHFKPGASVQWKQQRETVSHVVIRRNALMIYLVGNDTAVHPDTLQLGAYHPLPVARLRSLRPPRAVPWPRPAESPASEPTAG